MRNERLESLMGRALMLQNEGGPNADPPLSVRLVPRASLLSSGCARQAFYWLKGEPGQPFNHASAAAAQAGQALESDVLEHLRAALAIEYDDPGLSYETQVKVETPEFRGTADFWCPKYKILADSKTTGYDSFEIQARKGQPKEDHVRQLNLYAGALGATRILIPLRQVGRPGSHGDAPNYQVYDLTPDPEIYGEMLAVARTALAARAADQAPPRPAFASRTYWLCNPSPGKGYCAFRLKCWAAS